MNPYDSNWSIISWMTVLSAFNFASLSFHASSIASSRTFAFPFSFDFALVGSVLHLLCCPGGLAQGCSGLQCRRLQCQHPMPCWWSPYEFCCVISAADKAQASGLTSRRIQQLQAIPSSRFVRLRHQMPPGPLAGDCYLTLNDPTTLPPPGAPTLI
jgi:hypothetical protein